MKTIADQRTQTESLMVPNVTFVSNVVNKRVEDATQAHMKTKKEAIMPPSPPSSEPSDSEPSRSRRSRPSHRKKKSRREDTSCDSSKDSRHPRSSMGCVKKRDAISDEDTAPSLSIIRPVLDSFVDALDYRTYKLRNKSQYYNGRIAHKVSKYQERLKT